MNTIAPRTVVLLGGAQDGLTMDVAVDQSLVVVPAYDFAYAMKRAQRDPAFASSVLESLTYRDSGRVSSSGYPIFELVRA